MSEIEKLLKEIKAGAANLKESTEFWQESPVEYSNGISLLSLKNHLHLAYLHNLSTLLSCRLSQKPLDSKVVNSLIKLQVVLRKITPLEQKLRYQVEKLVKKADLGLRDEDVINDPLLFRPNPQALLDQNPDDSDSQEDEQSKDGIYRPPRVAAMPYTEEPTKKGKKLQKSHLLSDISTSISTSTPYSETTTGLSITHDPSFVSSTARHHAQIKEFEESNFTRLRMSKKESRKRRSEERDLAFGITSGSTGKGHRRLGGFGNEVDDLLRDISSNKTDGAYEKMKGFKRAKTAHQNTDGQLGQVSNTGRRSKFGKAVKRASKKGN